MKKLLLAVSVLALTCGTAMASNNQATITQDAASIGAVTNANQEGGGPVGSRLNVSQGGTFNDATVLQSGNGNFARVNQTASMNLSTVTQAGTGGIVNMVQN